MKSIGGVKSKETRSYRKEKCNSLIFSTFLGHVLFVTVIAHYPISLPPMFEFVLFPCNMSIGHCGVGCVVGVIATSFGVGIGLMSSVVVSRECGGHTEMVGYYRLEHRVACCCMGWV